MGTPHLCECACVCMCVCVYMCHREQYRGKADNQKQLSECLQTCCIEGDVHEEVQVVRWCGGGGGGGAKCKPVHEQLAAVQCPTYVKWLKSCVGVPTLLPGASMGFNSCNPDQYKVLTH